MVKNEINEIGKELNIQRFDFNLVNNVNIKHEEFGEIFRRNT